MNIGRTLQATLENLPACRTLCPDGIYTGGSAQPGAGALYQEEELARSEDISGNITRRLRWRLWLAHNAQTEKARCRTQTLCDTLRSAIEQAALPENFERLTAGPLRTAHVGTGGSGAYYMDLELTVTERMN